MKPEYNQSITIQNKKHIRSSFVDETSKLVKQNYFTKTK